MDLLHQRGKKFDPRGLFVLKPGDFPAFSWQPFSTAGNGRYVEIPSDT